MMKKDKKKTEIIFIAHADFGTYSVLTFRINGIAYNYRLKDRGLGYQIERISRRKPGKGLNLAKRFGKCNPLI